MPGETGVIMTEEDPLNPPPKYPLEKPSLATLRGTRVKFNPTGLSFFSEVTLSLEKVIFVERHMLKGTFLMQRAHGSMTDQTMLVLKGTQVYMKSGDIFLHHPFEEVSKIFQRYVDWQAEP